MFPGAFAASTPDKPAVIAAGSGESITFAELEERSVRVAHVLHDRGLRPGDVVALLTENTLTAFEVYWAAIRSGLYITAVNHHLSATEVAYIVEDSDAKAVIASAGKRELAESVASEVDSEVYLLAYGGPVTGYASYEDALARASTDPLTDQPRGVEMLYSSGTTGRPKGILPPLPEGQVDEVPDMVGALLQKSFGLSADTRYLSPAPLYHTAPLKWCAAVVAAGGTDPARSTSSRR
jgi:fatty-acyl-CoA synthase